MTPTRQPEEERRMPFPTMDYLFASTVGLLEAMTVYWQRLHPLPPTVPTLHPILQQHITTSEDDDDADYGFTCAKTPEGDWRMESPSSSEPPPLLWGRYRLAPWNARLGSGTFCAVFLLEDTANMSMGTGTNISMRDDGRRFVACKVVPRDLCPLLRQEHAVLARAQGDVPGLLVCPGRFVGGRRLCFLLQEALRPVDFGHCPSYPVKLQAVRGLMRDILCQLHYLHTQQRLVHADVRPENIMRRGNHSPVSDHSQFLLIDFGNAVNAEELSSLDYAPGTPSYQAPEIIALPPHAFDNATERPQRNWSDKLDIYALGLSILDLLHSASLGRAAQVDRRLLQSLLTDAGSLRDNNHRLLIYRLCRWTDMNDATCLDMLTRMLRMNPEQRPSALEALQHPFLACSFPYITK
jgi:serine/threonine protein kinase